MDSAHHPVVSRAAPQRDSPRGSAAPGVAQQTQLQDQLQNQLQTAQAALNHELKIVGQIQRSLLPEKLPDIPGFEIASFYQPSATAGGDYFDIVPLTNGHWGLVVADVAGHGASAAVIMAVMRALIHAHLPITRHLPSYQFLEFLNKQMTGAYTNDGRFVTAWCALLDPVARQLHYASAGHPPPRLLRAGAVISLDAAVGLPLGIDESSHYHHERLALQPGDLLVIYTDGITEAMRTGPSKKELFETHRLDRALIDSRPERALDCIRQVTAAVNAFTQGAPPTDDQTMLVIK